MFLSEHPDFKDLIGQVAGRMGVRNAIVEKDYWVTLALYHLAHSEFKDEFIFKGGTNLSKAFKLIKRFSEDVDLLFIDIGKKKRTRLEKIRDFISSQGFAYYEGDDHENSSGNESRTSCFDYQKNYADSLGVLLPFVKLEMGYRGGLTPHSFMPITSYIAEALFAAGEPGSYLDLKPFEIKVLAPERTLVEKLFALHSAFEKGEIEKRVRHYYDVYYLLGLPVVTNFLGTDDYKILKQDVHNFSVACFPNSPIPPVDKLHESNSLSPDHDTLKKIKIAHDGSDLIYGDKPQTEEIFQRISKYLIKI